MSTMIFDQSGSLRFIHDDAVAEIAREVGDLSIRRASHVEPTAKGEWEADMSPVRPGLVLGPYPTRKQALRAEVSWLKKHNVPLPKEN